MAKKTLIDLKSNLRDLNVAQFGGKQLVKNELPEYDQAGPSTNQLTARVDDLQRISKLITSTPQGLKFITNLSLLEKYNTRKEFNNFRDQGRSVAGSLLRTVGRDIANTAGAVGSALAQTPVNGTGTHFILGLTRDSYLKSGADNPLSRSQLGSFLRDIGVADNTNGGGAALKGETIEAGPNNVVSKLEGRESKLGPTPSDTPLKFDNPANIVKSLGSTIPPASIPLGETSDVDSDSKSKFVVNGKAVTEVDGKSLSDDNAFAVTSANQRIANEAIYTVRAKDNVPRPYTIADSTLSAKGINTKANIGSDGEPVAVKDSVQGSPFKLAPTDEYMATQLKADIIPFSFLSLNPEDDKNTSLYFRAYLDSLQDNFNASWNTSKYVGRAENFYRYSGFDRGVSFSFKVAATSVRDIIPLYEKLNLLAGQTAPSYASSGMFMRGTMTEVTIGDYLSKQKGFIQDVSFSWQVDYPWEINLYDAPNLPIVPHLLDVNIQFIPIHDFNVKSNIDIQGMESYFGSKKVNKPTNANNETAEPSVEAGQGEFGTSPDTGRDFSAEGGINPAGAMDPTTQKQFDSRWMDGKTTPKSHIPSAGLVQGDDSSWKNAYPNG